MQALMMAIKCADGAGDVCAVIPYLAYARQDRAFLEGEVVSIALIAKLLQSAGVRHVITVDIHSRLAMSHFSSVQNVSSIPLLAEYASKMKLRKPIAVSPDAGGAERAKEFAKYSKTDALALKKSRDRTTGEVTIDEKLDVDISGRDVILVDDMISSGASIVKAAEVLYKKGAGKVYALCAHALLIGDAAQKIKAAGVQDIIATNSVPGEYAKVDLSPAIAQVVKSRYSSA
jgi:ribose-phosphate pyrophosphokinase